MDILTHHTFLHSCNGRYGRAIALAYHCHNEPFFHDVHSSMIALLALDRENTHPHDRVVRIDAYHSPTIHHILPRMKIPWSSSRYPHILLGELLCRRNRSWQDPSSYTEGKGLDGKVWYSEVSQSIINPIHPHHYLQDTFVRARLVSLAQLVAAVRCVVSRSLGIALFAAKTEIVLGNDGSVVLTARTSPTRHHLVGRGIYRYAYVYQIHWLPFFSPLSQTHVPFNDLPAHVCTQFKWNTAQQQSHDQTWCAGLTTSIQIIHS